MKITLKHQAKRSAIALAAAAVFAAFGIGTAQAASFASASISVETQGEGAGGLNCSFRETGLGPYASVTYFCGATDVGVVSQCFYKNKPVGNPLPVLHFENVSNAGTEGEAEALMANNSGRISATVTAELPESEAGHGACTEPAVLTVTAVRWCNASLVDTTYNITGAGPVDVFAQIERAGTGTVPLCADLELLPPTPQPH
jgi:hypothetical protein